MYVTDGLLARRMCGLGQKKAKSPMKMFRNEHLQTVMIIMTVILQDPELLKSVNGSSQKASGPPTEPSADAQ